MGGLAALFGMADREAVAPLAETWGSRLGVDPNLVLAVIEAESTYSSRATHRDRDGGMSYGLMQLRLETARQLARNPSLDPTLLFDPDLNVQLGTTYLRDQLVRYGGDIEAAAAAYNAGTAFRTDGGGFTNQPYVDRVMRIYRASPESDWAASKRRADDVLAWTRSGRPWPYSDAPPAMAPDESISTGADAFPTLGLAVLVVGGAVLAALVLRG